jgi:hypothetical protein
MIIGQDIIDRWNPIKPCFKPDDMFADPDYILRHTEFVMTGDFDFDRQALTYWYMKAYKPMEAGEYERTPYEIYKSYSNAQFKLFKYAKASGYVTDTKQSCIQLACYTKDNLQMHVDELNYWLPHAVENKDGEIFVDIFEHNLSYHASYGIVYKKSENTITVKSNRRAIKVLLTWLDTVQYLIDNGLYYSDEAD